MFVSILPFHLCPPVILRRWASYLPRKKNYYEILGVNPNSTFAGIKQAFVKLSNELHPDRNIHCLGGRTGSSIADNAKRFVEVKEAYDCLRKPDRRVAYDNELKMVTESGYLMEAKSLRFNGTTIIDLNKQRNDAYEMTHMRFGKKSAVKAHFRDPEEDYYQEKNKNRMFFRLAGLISFLTLGNIACVWYLCARSH